MMTMESLFTVDEVAEKLDVSPRTVRRYIQADAIKAIRVGGQYKVKKEDLTAYLNGERGQFRDIPKEKIKADDLCVFMDSEYYRSDAPIQICSIIDVKMKDKALATPMAQGMMALLNDERHEGDHNTKFQYIYKEKDKIARFVVWGEPRMIETVMTWIKAYELSERN